MESRPGGRAMRSARGRGAAVSAVVASVLACGVWGLGCSSTPPSPPVSPVPESAPLPPVVGDCQPELPPPAPGPLRGVVLGADSEQGTFVLSVGRKEGVRPGDEVTVFRGDQFVAVVMVERVSEVDCTASIRKEDGRPLLKAGMQILQGDRVVTIF